MGQPVHTVRASCPSIMKSLTTSKAFPLPPLKCSISGQKSWGAAAMPSTCSDLHARRQKPV